MKTKYMLTVLAVLGMALTGCSAGTVTSESAGIASEQAAESSAAEAPESEAAQQAFDNWKDAYRQVLLDYQKSDAFSAEAKWDLQDLDLNSEPELLISAGSTHADGVYAYFFNADGTVSQLVDEDGNLLSLGAYGKMLSCPEIRYVATAYLHQGFSRTTVFRIEEHTAIQEKTFDDTDSAMVDGNAVYHIDGEEVSKTMYEDEVQQFHANDWRQVGAQYTFDDLSLLG